MHKGKTGKNEGEGSRIHDQNYRAGVQAHLKKGHVEQEAKAAEKALDGPEGGELRRAEAAGRHGKTVRH